MKWERLCKLAGELPEVKESISYRTPSLEVRGKGLARLKEDGKTVVFMLPSVDEQEFLVATQPDLYFITDHYRGWPAVLARLSKLKDSECRLRLEQAWRRKAPRSLVTKRDAAAGASAAGHGATRGRSSSSRAARGPSSRRRR